MEVVLAKKDAEIVIPMAEWGKGKCRHFSQRRTGDPA
jgi:hypothetical protein